MAKKHAGPNLYELMGGTRGEGGTTNGVSTPTPPRFEVHEPPEPVQPSGNWLIAGRVLRVPVGYLFIAAAAVVVILALVYMFAYNRGNESGRSAAKQDIKALSEADEIGRTTVDPLVNGRGGTGPTTGAPLGSTDRGDSSRTARNSDRGGSAGHAGYGEVTEDRRRAGLNYLNLAAYPQKTAFELVEFCRARGLEAYAVRSNNRSFYQVFLLPGFEPGTLGSPAARKLREDARAVGRAWHAQDPGQHDDLGNSYFARH